MIIEKKKSTFLDNLIKFLMALVLLGALFLVSINIVEKFNKDNKQEAKNIKQPQAHIAKQIKKTPLKSIENKDKKIDKNIPDTTKKVYTQEEMQEIVQMMMDQMQELNSQTKASATKLTIDNSNDVNELINSLENVVEDNTEDIEEEIKEVKEQTASLDKNVSDHYNKVVINNSQYSSENLDQLSTKISNIIDDMSSKPIEKTNYTNNISKEITTRSNEMRVIVVKDGDTLSKIALRAYGKISAYTKIIEANRDLIKNPNHIYVGQRLRVPTL